MKLLPAKTISPRVKTVEAAPFLILMVTLALSGCRCPWTTANAQLNDSSRWLQSGIEAFHSGKNQEAETLLVQAIDSRPGDPVLREHLASIYLKRGKTTDAISQLMQASEISGQSADLLAKIGRIYLDNGHWIPAREFAEKAIAANQKLPEAWALKADIEVNNGDLTQALSDYQRCLSLNPDQPDVQLKVAEVHRLSGRTMRAFSTIEQMLSKMAVHEQPENALLLSSRLLMELKQPLQALEKLKIATSRPDASPESFIQLANANMVVGQDARAISTLVDARHRFPENQQIDRRLTEIENSNERFAALESHQENLIR